MAGNPITLANLLSDHDLSTLLGKFAILTPGLGLALIHSDGELLAEAGQWSEKVLEIARSRVDNWLDELANKQTITTSSYRCYPLHIGEQLTGILIASGGPPHGNYAPEQALHHTLGIILALNHQLKHPPG